MNPEHIILHLSLIQGIGPAIVNRILETITVDQLTTLYTFCAIDFVTHCGIRLSTAQELVSGLANVALLEREHERIQKHNVHLITILNKVYPALLRAIHMPPAVLYLKGSFLHETEHTIAFVGARAATNYGKKIVDAFIPSLVNHGWHIISGGAQGIDTFAHQAAVTAQGKTTVVLGSGLLQLYPTQNMKLFSTILDQGGALITPFSMMAPPLPGNFPARNRIIAGLSKACVVVQAARKSGALITASFALEQGKEIFAVPGAFDDSLSAGCHALFKQGAYVATSADDILEVFGYSIPHEQPLEQKSISSMITAPESVNPLIALCKQPIAIDTLAQQTGLSLLELQTSLFELQLEGVVSQNFMGLWHQRL